MILAQGLTRRFGAFLAVDALDLDVAEGEVFGFLGPNGAGKTTTVRMLAALIAPSAGRAIVAGHSVLDAPDRVRAAIGILTEVPGLYMRLDAVENLRFFGEIHGVPRLERRIVEVLDRLDLGARRHEPVGGWSKGMRQRLAIARAILHAPRVLFLDEPTSALDPLAARTVRELVGELRRDGRTVVLCTHNLDEAERLCDRIAVIKTRVLRAGTPAELRRASARARTIVRLARAGERDLVAIARGLPFVWSAELAGVELRVAIDDPEHGNPILVRELAAAGAEIRSVLEESRTLEQIYLELVGEDGAIA